MIGGSTPTNVFCLPFSTSLLSKVRIVYAQDKEILFMKEESHCVFKNDTIEVTLTQKETLMLDHKKTLMIQGHFLTNDGTALVSKIKKVTVDEFLDREVLA
jgi:hypothetical protein